MDTLNKFLLGAFALIALYLVVNSQESSSLIQSFAQGSSQVFSTLQGR